MAGYSAVELASSVHRTQDFDCGKPELNRFLQRFALANQATGSARTYVICAGGAVVGYYALAAASVTRDRTPRRVATGMPTQVPVILLARLAVDLRGQGRGLGAALLKDALIRSSSAAGQIGARAVLVHAKDESARSFYRHFGFEESPTDPLHMFLLMKDLRSWIRSVG